MTPNRALAGEIERQGLRRGAEVKSPRGNLLVAHGFARLPYARGSSRCRLRWHDRWIELHSFCVTLCGDGRPGLRFLRPRQRVYLDPREEPTPPAETADDALVLPFVAVERAAFLAGSAP
ncbi:MAG: hypothetical protein ACKVYV_01760 [Limisphaerales bacterium]